MYVSVVVRRPFCEMLTYNLPESLLKDKNPGEILGSLVKVPMGNKTTYGILWSLTPKDFPKDSSIVIKDIQEIFSEIQGTASWRRFLEIMAQYYICPLGKVLPLGLPTFNYEKLLEKKPTEKEMSFDFQGSPLVLTDPQQKALKTIEDVFSPPSHFNSLLLHGITGSGKSEVLLSYGEKIWAQGKQVLFLLPEISLTIPWIQRYEKYFGHKPALWHSFLTPRQRWENFYHGVVGDGLCIVGARSALCLPYKNLGLIVVDEEHEQSYKQSDGVLYHGRDMALLRGKVENIPVILSSASPSLETLYHVEGGHCAYVPLLVRYNNLPLAKFTTLEEVFVPGASKKTPYSSQNHLKTSINDENHAKKTPPQLCDLKKDIMASGSLLDISENNKKENTQELGSCSTYHSTQHWKKSQECQGKNTSEDFKKPSAVPFSPGKSLIQENALNKIREALQRREQALVFLNKRGYASLMVCPNCAHRYGCPRCKGWLSVHKKNHGLLCHYCNYKEILPSQCVSCGFSGPMTMVGPGIEQLYDGLCEALPEARLCLMSSDHVASAKNMKNILEKIHHRHIDVVVGTQLVAKGHHFPYLTCIVVLGGDQALQDIDFRSQERWMQTLIQVTGRAGRQNHEGYAYVQTRHPNHDLFKTMEEGTFYDFAKKELHHRQSHDLPPYRRLTFITFSHKNAFLAEEQASRFALCQPPDPGEEKLRIFGPSPAPLSPLRGEHRWRVLLQSHRQFSLSPYIQQWVSLFKKQYILPVSMTIDRDPYSLI